MSRMTLADQGEKRTIRFVSAGIQTASLSTGSLGERCGFVFETAQDYSTGSLVGAYSNEMNLK
jgi:hypothetical protein